MKSLPVLSKAAYTLSGKLPICVRGILSEENLKHFRFSSDPAWNIFFSTCLLNEQWKVFLQRRRMERKEKGRQKQRQSVAISLSHFFKISSLAL